MFMAKIGQHFGEGETLKEAFDNAAKKSADAGDLFESFEEVTFFTCTSVKCHIEVTDLT